VEAKAARPLPRQLTGPYHRALLRHLSTDLGWDEVVAETRRNSHHHSLRFPLGSERVTMAFTRRFRAGVTAGTCHPIPGHHDYLRAQAGARRS
jgi:hypothetical protein